MVGIVLIISASPVQSVATNEFRPRHDDGDDDDDVEGDGTMRSKFLLPSLGGLYGTDEEEEGLGGGGSRCIRQWPSGSKVFFCADAVETNLCTFRCSDGAHYWPVVALLTASCFAPCHPPPCQRRVPLG